MNGVSRYLSRAITDFGSDDSFSSASFKLHEHYGLDFSASRLRDITEHHAQSISHGFEDFSSYENNAHRNLQLICETDGTMLPIVEYTALNGNKAMDKRKHKTLKYKEAKLSLAYRHGDVDPFYRSTFGDKNDAGAQMKWCAKKAGFNDTSKVHCVGDGASWIAEQVDEQFGTQAHYLIDFYHLCEYLADAANTLDVEKKEQEQWLVTQKKRMLDNQTQSVLNELEKHTKKDKTDTNPLFRCYRYISNRAKQFDYRKAINQNLPIGSGKVESAHRNVLQKRLKIPGAWWKKDNAQNMMDLRALRKNGDWERYWEKNKIAA